VREYVSLSPSFLLLLLLAVVYSLPPSLSRACALFRFVSVTHSSLARLLGGYD